MKRTNYITIIITIMIVLVSCEKFLEKEPGNLIAETAVYEDSNLVDAYLNDIYKRMEFLVLTGNTNNEMITVACMGAECRPFANWQSAYAAATRNMTTANGAHSAIDYWDYVNIRYVNDFIEKISISGFSEEYIDLKVAEARFLRAFMYFELVKRYGGVPLITRVQSQDDPYDELYRKRNTEKEIYDFIAAEMDEIFTALPRNNTANDYGRPTRWAAMALKSRSMLYAASIAQFDGVEQLDGVVGILSSNAQDYWQKCYDASLLVIDSSGHRLFNEFDDPAENYGQLFLAEGDDNPEAIFVEQFDETVDLGHSWANLAMPDGFAATWGSNFNPYWEFVQLYENSDGSTVNINYVDIDGENTLVLNGDTLISIDDLFGDRDPRFQATVFYPEVDWQGGKVYFHSGTIITDTITSEESVVTEGVIGDENWPAKAPDRNTARTGFHLRKRLNEGYIQPLRYEDGTDYIIFRLGEMYLNLAEAAYYLGNTSGALDAINEIRSRAGMPDKTAVDEDVIRNERQVELAYEDHRYWDLRRWRIAAVVLGGVQHTGLQYFYDYSTRNYRVSTIVPANSSENAYTFNQEHYYFPIRNERIGDNPNLVENPGY